MKTNSTSSAKVIDFRTLQILQLVGANVKSTDELIFIDELLMPLWDIRYEERSNAWLALMRRLRIATPLPIEADDLNHAVKPPVKVATLPSQAVSSLGS